MNNLDDAKSIISAAQVGAPNSNTYSLTKIHTCISKKRSRCPYVWLKTKQARMLIERTEQDLGMPKGSLVDKQLRRDTLAPLVIASAYIFWLSDDLHRCLLQNFCSNFTQKGE